MAARASISSLESSVFGSLALSTYRASLAQKFRVHRQDLWKDVESSLRKHRVQLKDTWRSFEHRSAAVYTALCDSNTGQKVLTSMLPMAVVSQLFPGRFQCLALEFANSARYHPDVLPPTKPAYNLLAHLQLPVVMQQLLDELRTLLRGLYLALLFTPCIVSAPVALWAGGAHREQWMQLMCWTLERAGPAFIKWGQWAATRPDLFPPDLCSSMERLQASAPSHPAAFSRAVIASSLGVPVDRLFDAFEDQPVASGSIAQVHRARLSAVGAAATGGQYKPGTCVAVKVRHPHVTTLMYHDFILMQRAAKLLSHIPALAELRLDESIRQFGGPLKEQLDLAVEASHLSRFHRNFRTSSIVSFPTPLYPLVSSDVLVETFEDGAAISKYVNLPASKQRCVLAEAGLNCYLQMLLKDNFIHADLHPGNILVREGATPRGMLARTVNYWLPGTVRIPPKLVLLDTGMIAELSKTDQSNLIAFFKALTKQDGEGLGHAILNMSEQYTCKDPAAFIGAVKDMFETLDPDYISRNTSRVIGSVIDTLREHQVTLRSTVSTVVVTTLVLEGWSSKLNPDMRILDHMRDVLSVDWPDRIGRVVDKFMRAGALAVV